MTGTNIYLQISQVDIVIIENKFYKKKSLSVTKRFHALKYFFIVKRMLTFDINILIPELVNVSLCLNLFIFMIHDSHFLHML